MDSFLRKEGSEGVYDSAGSFTIDSRLAREKRAKYALAQPGEWALKVIQAGIGAGAKQVKITAGKNRVEIDFADSIRYIDTPNPNGWSVRTEPMWLESHLHAVLTAPGLPEGPGWLQDLSTGLFSIPDDPGVRVKLAVTGARTDFVRVSHAWEREKKNRILDHTLVEVSGLSSEQVAAVHLVVSRRAGGSPVPLVLDGRGFDNLRLHAPGLSDLNRVIVAGGALPLNELGPFVVSPRTFSPPLKSIRSELRTHLDFAWDRQPHEPAGSGCWLLSLDLGKIPRKFPCEIAWYRYGVEMKRSTFNSGTGRASLYFLINADFLPTDLTGLRLKEGTEFSQARARVLECLAAGLALPQTIRVSQETRERTGTFMELISGVFPSFVELPIRDWRAIEKEIAEDLVKLSHTPLGESISE